MDTLILIIGSLVLVAVILVIIILNVIQNYQNNKLKKHLNTLEYQKNLIDSTPILPELSKIEAFLKNEKLEIMYNEWKNRLQLIKDNQIPHLSDLIIEADYNLSHKNYKSSLYKIAKLEMEIYKVRANAEKLLDEIKAITTSEERNRAIITKLKAKYRELYQKYNDSKSDYGDIAKSIGLQFENIAFRFDNFETVMENNEYTEVTQIIKAIDEMLKHMEVVIEEVPSIEMLAKNVIPKKISQVIETYNNMVKNGYPLDYLNIEYNVNEANKKINDIQDRAKVLNLEDSLFELKLLLEYFDSLFNDFEKEKINRYSYEEANKNFKNKLEKINKLVNDIYAQIDDIKNVYNLSKDDITLLDEVKVELNNLGNDYKLLLSHTSNNTFAYSKLTKEIEYLAVRLANIENRLDNSLEAIGTMREDEVRARQQLKEVEVIFDESKSKLREYNLPVIPKTYIMELNEAQAAIKEIMKELNKTPITISVLNTRVDTGRDLVLKFFNTTKEMMKTAMFAEMAMVYGNRYRTSIEDLDKNLSASETLFYKGEYQKSLELTINSLNRVEPGIYDKLLNLYPEEK